MKNEIRTIEMDKIFNSVNEPLVLSYNRYLGVEDIQETLSEHAFLSDSETGGISQFVKNELCSVIFNTHSKGKAIFDLQTNSPMSTDIFGCISLLIRDFFVFVSSADFHPESDNVSLIRNNPLEVVTAIILDKSGYLEQVYKENHLLTKTECLLIAIDFSADQFLNEGDYLKDITRRQLTSSIKEVKPLLINEFEIKPQKTITRPEFYVDVLSTSVPVTIDVTGTDDYKNLIAFWRKTCKSCKPRFRDNIYSILLDLPLTDLKRNRTDYQVNAIFNEYKDKVDDFIPFNEEIKIARTCERELSLTGANIVENSFNYPSTSLRRLKNVIQIQARKLFDTAETRNELRLFEFEDPKVMNIIGRRFGKSIANIQISNLPNINDSLVEIELTDTIHILGLKKDGRFFKIPEEYMSDIFRPRFSNWAIDTIYLPKNVLNENGGLRKVYFNSSLEIFSQEPENYVRPNEHPNISKDSIL